MPRMDNGEEGSRSIAKTCATKSCQKTSAKSALNFGTILQCFVVNFRDLTKIDNVFLKFSAKQVPRGVLLCAWLFFEAWF